MTIHFSQTTVGEADVIVSTSDRPGCVKLTLEYLGGLGVFASLRPAEARLIARHLNAAAAFLDEIPPGFGPVESDEPEPATWAPAETIPPPTCKDSLPVEPAPAPPMPREGRPQRHVSPDDAGNALAAANGNKSEAARALGISRLTLYRRLDRWGIRKFGSHKEPGHAD